MKQIKSLLQDFIAIPSDTATTLENDMSQALTDVISQMDYFKEHPDHHGSFPVGPDSLGRTAKWALYRGSSSETIIMINHHDVVDVHCYGELRELAYTPEDLATALKDKVKNSAVLKDIDSGDWLFGRGSADMKAGLTIQLIVLEKLSREGFPGSLLFLSVGDEESLSRGMIAAAPVLNDLASQFSLEYVLLINSEPHERTDPHTMVIYDGSIGKTMITVYIRGIKAHIGHVLQGFNPSLILANLVRNTESNLDLADRAKGEVGPPPTWSYMRDFKESYDASIPESAGGYLSFLTMSKSPTDILQQLKEVSESCLDDAICHMNKQLQASSRDTLKTSGQVNTYQELIKDIEKLHGDDASDLLEKCTSQAKQKLSEGFTIQEATFEVIRLLLEHTDYDHPTIVLAISPPYYPHVSSDSDEPLTLIKQLAKEDSKSVSITHFFEGISDLSYCNMTLTEDETNAITQNMPLWDDAFYSMDFEAMRKLRFPIINIGPWGKDLHKTTERVYLPDVEKTIPHWIEMVLRGYAKKTID